MIPGTSQDFGRDDSRGSWTKKNKNRVILSEQRRLLPRMHQVCWSERRRARGAGSARQHRLPGLVTMAILTATFLVSQGLSSFPSSNMFSSMGGTGYGNTEGQNSDVSKHMMTSSYRNWSIINDCLLEKAVFMELTSPALSITVTYRITHTHTHTKLNILSGAICGTVCY